jgi:hypothetical protein
MFLYSLDKGMIGMPPFAYLIAVVVIKLGIKLVVLLKPGMFDKPDDDENLFSL